MADGLVSCEIAPLKLVDYNEMYEKGNQIASLLDKILNYKLQNRY